MGVYLNPFTRIVGVGWGGKPRYATVRYQYQQAVTSLGGGPISCPVGEGFDWSGAYYGIVLAGWEYRFYFVKDIAGTPAESGDLTVRLHYVDDNGATPTMVYLKDAEGVAPTFPIMPTVRVEQMDTIYYFPPYHFVPGAGDAPPHDPKYPTLSLSAWKDGTSLAVQCNAKVVSAAGPITCIGQVGLPGELERPFISSETGADTGKGLSLSFSGFSYEDQSYAFAGYKLVRDYDPGGGAGINGIIDILYRVTDD